MWGARRCAPCRASTATNRGSALAAGARRPGFGAGDLFRGATASRRRWHFGRGGRQHRGGADARVPALALHLARDRDGRRRRFRIAGGGFAGRIKRVAGNTFGRVFTVTSFGESHGPALGCVVDGCPPGLALERGGSADGRGSAPPGHLAVHDASGARPTRCASCRACSRARPPARRSGSWSRTRISARATTRRSRIAFVPATRTTPTSRNTAFATIAAAAAPRRARP